MYNSWSVSGIDQENMFCSATYNKVIDSGTEQVTMDFAQENKGAIIISFSVRKEIADDLFKCIERHKIK